MASASRLGLGQVHNLEPILLGERRKQLFLIDEAARDGHLTGR